MTKVPTPRPDRVLRLLLMFVGLGFLATLGRVVQLQTAPPDPLRPFLSAGVRSATLPGVRGDIYDSRGRLLSTTRFGTRLVIDPTLFPADPHEAIGLLCDATGLDPADVGPRILRSQAENLIRADRRQRLAQAGLNSSPDPLPLAAGGHDSNPLPARVLKSCLLYTSDAADE